MKIIDKINNFLNYGSSEIDPYFSFEFFPPKTQAGVENLYSRIDKMTYMQPIFVDVTWGAGGSTKELSLSICNYIQTYFGIEALLHLSCTNLRVEEIKKLLMEAKKLGIHNLLILRGDSLKGSTEWKPIEGGFEYAIDLIRYIRQEHGDYFGIAVAGFPEGHPSRIMSKILTLSNTTTTSTGTKNSTDSTSDIQPSSSSHDEEISDVSHDATNISSDTSLYSIDKNLLLHQDIFYLKEKIDTGADFIITNFFYDSFLYLNYIRLCRDTGITCPIIPGLMPIQSYKSFKLMTDYCQVYVPSYIWKELDPIKEDDDAVKTYGVQLCVKICKELIDAQIPGFHFYTLNLERSVMSILKELGIEQSRAVRRSLPWRGSRLNIDYNLSYDQSTTNTTTTTTTNGAIISNSMNTNAIAVATSSSPRPGISRNVSINNTTDSTTTTTTTTTTTSNNTNTAIVSPTTTNTTTTINRPYLEEIRPINWANRSKSYIRRTSTWDEFPNGRWGDNRSPAFGDLSETTHFYKVMDGTTKEDLLAIWGEAPILPQDIYEIFVKYVKGDIPIIPWCETSLEKETSIISNPLVYMNGKGFLTINSQPAVNGEKSDHPVFGWGGPGGRVYQKAYVEFFVAPENLKYITTITEKYPNLTIYGVDCQGNFINISNTTSGNNSGSSGGQLGAVNSNSSLQSMNTTGLNTVEKKQMIKSKGVTAVTWGVFPNKEILQPTIFDPKTFLIWSQEAFQLWLQIWARIYDDDSESCELIYTIHDTYYLIAMIDNDYINSTLFQTIQEILQYKEECEIHESTITPDEDDDEEDEED